MHACAVWLMHCWFDMHLIFINAYVRNVSLLVVKWPTSVLYAQGKEGLNRIRDSSSGFLCHAWTDL